MAIDSVRAGMAARATLWPTIVGGAEKAAAEERQRAATRNRNMIFVGVVVRFDVHSSRSKLEAS